MIGFSGGSTAFFPVFGWPLFPYGTYFVAIYTFIVAYAIIQYRFLDIRTVIHKPLVWFAMSSIILLPLGTVLFLTKDHFASMSKIQFSIFISLVVAFLIPYTKFIQPRIDHLFQRRKYDKQKILQGMVQELAALKDLSGLINKIVTTIQEALYVSKTTLVLWDDKALCFKAVTGELIGGIKSFNSDNPFLSWMKERDQVIDLIEIELNPDYAPIRKAATDYFKQFDAKIALPLIHDNKLIGLVNLGEKDNLKPFSDLDLDFLSNLRAEASIALSNSLLYDDVSK